TATIANAIVQPRRPSLPELDRFGRYAVATPVRRARNGVAVLAKLVGHRREARFQRAAIGNDLALRRSPRSQPRSEWTGGEIRVRFDVSDLARDAVDAH